MGTVLYLIGRSFYQLFYFLYYIFDLCDGKHARNTGNSSPLGLLMDHGCDAVTTFVFIFALGSIIRLGKLYNH